MRRIESHKAFPYIAWTTFLLFAAFTWYLALELQETAAYLDIKVENNLNALEEG